MSRGERPTLALVGNPNSGKTTLFNALTGLRQKVGNYPGVTVERKEGLIALPGGEMLTLIDLPGMYSLSPRSPDEVIARDVLLGYAPETPRPDAVINVVDASNLERNLYLTSQILDLGIPTLIVLTMTDTARQHGIAVDSEMLAETLGVPVVSVIAARRAGLDNLRRILSGIPALPAPPHRRWSVTPSAEHQLSQVSNELRAQHALPDTAAFAEAAALLGIAPDEGNHPERRWGPAVRTTVERARQTLLAEGLDLPSLITEARYAEAGRIAARAAHRETAAAQTLSDKIDRLVLHRVWGYVLFVAIMYIVFQAMFSWASLPADGITAIVDAAGGWIAAHLPAGDLRDLLVNGVIAGVGNTVVFLPQILLLFLLIALLEDTGYLARAAFLMDRLMSRVGLHGKSFIPLLSSYACAIPGVMATRTIESPRARLLTILVAPLMSCSARLPVYALMIGAFIPKVRVLGLFSLPAVTLLSMYALGTTAAFGMAWLFNRTLLRQSDPPSFLMEMPPYRLPSLQTVVLQMIERAWLFLRRAGTVILAITVVLWFLASYPKQPDHLPASEQVRNSYAGKLGRAIEPMIKPLGFDWKMGIGIVSSFAAREVFVSAMGTIYNVDEDTASDENKLSVSLGEKMRSDTNPRTGAPVFTPLVAVALMVYYVLAMQCMSTIAVVRRETNGWKWPLFQIAYMTALAWIVTFFVYQGGKLLGYG